MQGCERTVEGHRRLIYIHATTTAGKMHSVAATFLIVSSPRSPGSCRRERTDLKRHWKVRRESAESPKLAEQELWGQITQRLILPHVRGIVIKLL